MPATANALQPPLPGDPAPWFHAVSAGNPRYNFASVAGRYVLLAFAGPAAIPRLAGLLEPLRADGILDDLTATAMLVVPGPLPEEGAPDRLPGLRVLSDPDGAVFRAYGLLRPAPSGQAMLGTGAFLLDPLLRVMAVAPLDRLGDLLDLLRRLPAPHLHAGQEAPAPVLLLPRVFEPEFCRRLIALYEEKGGEDSGFMVEREGRTVGVHDYGFKRRADCAIEDPALQAAIRARIARRILPEVRKAFAFEATRIERYLIACYEGGTRGHFRAHRDNTTPGTAHRRFAVTINLNDGFEGGELWFPEFGSRRYRPPAGGAVVFSCSLLHEATPVTRGIRYAALPFLYDEAAARIRAANAGSLAPPPEPSLASAAADE
ncbi:2OG-Fe(II) oxygenase family protein [Paracraurococcus lichenis]|uniref:2OG-Fe(II) oxygenase n=1 Tax=Paracraurococcus lichenis TaxID=3064888 RepID=A0ABT9DXW4_9PROT|nr:2OG-Fe(II) oxygenase [Paracraurococcus sp. LOR1-02]MDO9708744.1 2OG-Fe(II) oxygenase [Paracraurococcus sp. LOR1-02]